MTEDDTFKKLRRITFEEMAEKFCEWLKIVALEKLTQADVDLFFDEHGWTTADYDVLALEENRRYD